MTNCTNEHSGRAAAPEPDPLLQIRDWLPDVTDILGPGRRAVVWVQGCSMRCPGCMVPETWSAAGGTAIAVSALAEAILRVPGVTGLTVSGGEPTEQPAAVASLLLRVRDAGLDTWVYTGATFEALVARADPAIDRLLAHTDVLVDGPYSLLAQGERRFRGSSNQRLLVLGGSEAAERVRTARPRQFEVRVSGDGNLTLVGCPPPGTLARLRKRLAARGVVLDSPWA